METADTTDFTVAKYGHGRFWAVKDRQGELVCVCVYKRGAVEVARRLNLAAWSAPSYLCETPPELSRKPVLEEPEAPGRAI